MRATTAAEMPCRRLVYRTWVAGEIGWRIGWVLLLERLKSARPSLEIDLR